MALFERPEFYFLVLFVVGIIVGVRWLVRNLRRQPDR
jgi:hypothetical protein